MHLKQCLCFAALTLGVLVSGSTSLHAQGMFGGNVNGTPGIALPPTDLYRSLSTGRAYTDLELTAITRAEEDSANQAVLDSIDRKSTRLNSSHT